MSVSDTQDSNIAKLRAQIHGADQSQIHRLVSNLPGNEPTDLGNADRFARAARGRLKYVPAWGWLCNDGVKWVRNDVKPRQLAGEVARSILTEAASVTDRSEQDALISWAKRSQSRERIGAMVDLARTHHTLVAEPDAFDKDPYALNVQNGVIDLRTGQFRERSEGDQFTRAVSTHYDPDAEPELWLDFLAEILDDDLDLMAYIQRALGYSLTGSTGEQVFFFCFGSGANGKSVFLETVEALMGDYAQNARTETFLLGQGGQITNDVARMDGARFIGLNETPEGSRLNENLIKDFTGGDTITARFLHKEYFDFKPQAKLWVRGNHKPIVRGTDDGIWRRIQLIPFTVQIPKEKRDKQLTERLRAEYPGILNWIIEGCLAWQRHGLKAAKAVAEWTASYRDEQDLFGDFIEECCEVGADNSIQSSALYERYNQWARDSGYRPMSTAAMSRTLEERGFVKRKNKAGKHWHGIA